LWKLSAFSRLDSLLRFCATERGTRADQAVERLDHRAAEFDRLHHRMDGGYLPELRRWPAGALPVGFWRQRDAQRTEAVIAGEEQVLQDGQPAGCFDMPDHPLAPPVRPGVVDRARQGPARACELCSLPWFRQDRIAYHLAGLCIRRCIVQVWGCRKLPGPPNSSVRQFVSTTDCV
jgi:hypothetical protein